MPRQRLLVLVVASLAVLAAAVALVVQRPETPAPDVETAPEQPEPSVGRVPAASPSAAPSLPADVLLPNMRSRAAFDFRIEGRPPDRVLRFAASLANHGPGPMLVEPLGRRTCPRGQQQVRQVLQRDSDGNGAFERGRDSDRLNRRSACMLRHPTHDHWHFDAMASYVLRVARTGEELSARRKVSFCLRDNERVPGVESRVRRSWFGDCTATTGQGISPGWADVYGPDLDGQSLRLPRAAAGRRLCLELEADPRQRLLESAEGDNATSVALRVRGDDVRRIGRDCA